MKLKLEIQNTFLFLPLRGLNPLHLKRAEYTISLLRLNVRDEVVAARRSAYGSFKARLFEYNKRKAVGASQAHLNRLISGIQNMPHPTVWKEMQRQADTFAELKELFDDSPEAQGW